MRLKAKSTHTVSVADPVKVEDGDIEIGNSQRAVSPLLDPEDFKGGRTHQAVSAKMSTKPIVAADVDPVLDDDLEVDEDEVDAADDLPVADVPDEDDSDEEESDDVVSEFEDIDAELDDAAEPTDEVGAEFTDLPVEAADDDEQETGVDDGDVEDETDVELEEATVADVDEVPDEVEDDDLDVVAVKAALHVMYRGRVLATLTKAVAERQGISDVYLTPTFAAVVANSVAVKGVRKGLVQAGFRLAKVNVTSAAAQKQVIEARVQSVLTARLQEQADYRKRLNQSLALAAVGVNRKFFKNVRNDLRAALEREFKVAGVENASQIVRSCFAQHGIEFARSLLTVAETLCEKPDEVRNQYAEALDMTVDEPEAQDEQVEETSVTAALLRPATRVPATPVTVTASVEQILRGNKSLF